MSMSTAGAVQKEPGLLGGHPEAKERRLDTSRTSQVGKLSVEMELAVPAVETGSLPLDSKLLKIRPLKRYGIRNKVAEEDKDEAYRLQRLKNASAAQRSRAKKRALDKERMETIHAQANRIAELQDEHERLSEINQIFERIIEGSLGAKESQEQGQRAPGPPAASQKQMN